MTPEGGISPSVSYRTVTWCAPEEKGSMVCGGGDTVNFVDWCRLGQSKRAKLSNRSIREVIHYTKHPFQKTLDILMGFDPVFPAIRSSMLLEVELKTWVIGRMVSIQKTSSTEEVPTHSKTWIRSPQKNILMKHEECRASTTRT